MVIGTHLNRLLLNNKGRLRGEQLPKFVQEFVQVDIDDWKIDEGVGIVMGE